MSLDQTIVLRDANALQTVIRIITRYTEAMLQAGKPLAVHLYEYVEGCTYPQQKFMWLTITQIARQASIDGRKFHKDVWHQHLKETFLPEEDGPSKRCKKHYRKWIYMPNGERRLNASTNDLTTFGKSEYQMKIDAYATQELGVRLSANPKQYEDCYV